MENCDKHEDVVITPRDLPALAGETGEGSAGRPRYSRVPTSFAESCCAGRCPLCKGELISLVTCRGPEILCNACPPPWGIQVRDMRRINKLKEKGPEDVD